MTAPAREPLKAWLKEHWRPLLVVGILGLVPFLSIIFSGKIIMASDQMGAPGWRFYFDALRQGEIPLWNPYGLGGMPTFDAMFGDASYPFFLILGFLLPVTHIVTFNFVLHTLIAGFASYLLAQRYFRLDRWPAAALAVAYMLNTNFISHIHAGHTGKFHIMAFLPLSLFFLLRALGPTAHWKHFLGLSITVALFIMTSHLQFTYYVLMGFFLTWLYFLIPLLKAKRFGSAGISALRFWMPILLGIGLVFFIFYPPLKYTEEFGVRGSGAKSTYEHATSWSMHPEETASLLVPEFGGINEKYWGRNYFKLNSEYPGLLVWFLALLGLFAFRKKKWFWFWGGMGLLAMIFGLGAHTPFFKLLYEFIPGIKNFRAPSMMLFWLAMALFLMGGETLRLLLATGEEALPDLERKKLLKKLRIAGFSTAGFLVICGLAPAMMYSIWGGDASQMPNLPKQDMARSAFALGAFRSAALVGILTWAAGAFLLQARRPMAFGIAALAVAAVDLYWVNSNFISGYAADRALQEEPAVDRLKADTTRFRVFGFGAYERWFMQYHGIETADGWTDNEMRVYREYRGGDYQRNPNLMAGIRQNADGSVEGSVFLDLLNVKYLGYRLPDDPGLKMAVNNSALPRAFFVPMWETAGDSQALQKMKEPGFNPRNLVYVSGPGLTSGGSMPDSGSAPASVVAGPRKYNRQTYDVDAPSEGVLFLSELWFPHWKVKVDGVEASLLKADFAFRGVMLKPGKHKVEFCYQSPWLRKGMWVSLASAVGLGIFCLSGALFRKQGPDL